ncbi:MAG: hypothetical protein CM1200mP2_35930 [Planctomycetaceae bacterium]|nr:MAG: hypothetical protein CM1200mP2_35930 [Planctomycetaceae bacterium]
MSTSTIRSGNVHFEFEGQTVLARPGQSIAAALWAAQHTAFGRPGDAAPRGTSAEWASASTAWSPRRPPQLPGLPGAGADGMV